MGRKTVVAAFVCVAILALAALVAKDSAKSTGSILGEERLRTGTFEGQYKDGKPHGRGILTFPNGDRYEGEFVDGKIDGRGTMFLSTGDIYAIADLDGVFDSRGIQGCGIYVGANGDRYFGEFKDGRFDGRGTYEWKNGRGATCGWQAGKSVEDTCIAHPAVGIGKHFKGDGVCASLGDNDLLKMEKRRRENECRERFGKDSAGYRECRARVRVLGVSDLRVREP